MDPIGNKHFGFNGLSNVTILDVHVIYSRTLKTPVTYRLYSEQNSV